MNKYVLFGPLLVATALEASGDAVVRMDVGGQACGRRLGLFAIGGLVLLA